MYELTKLIREDMKPALGVTEPGAIAFAAASARAHVQGELRKVRVSLNSGMYKNAFTCGIPNSSNFGNLYAAALGAVAADAGKGLESLEDITPEDDRKAEKLVAEGLVEVVMDHIGSEITIDASVETEQDECTVHIRDSHTHIISIEKNGRQIYADAVGAVGAGNTGDALDVGNVGNTVEAGNTRDAEDAVDAVDAGNTGADTTGASGQEIPAIHRYSLREILEYIREVPAEEISFIREAFSMNMELFEEGLASGRGVIARQLLMENGDEVISRDALKTAQLLCNGAIEARVLGLGRPAMSITGSGAHGIIATMPVYAWDQVCSKETAGEALKAEDEARLLRAAALSCLITMYIKEYSGRLSAFCGCGIAAGTGMACGLAFYRGADTAKIEGVIRNMASGLTGMICDGGSHGCTMKGIVAVDAAFRAVSMAMAGVSIASIHGINGGTPEETMRYMGMIASPGMVQTEKTIVEIMEQKRISETELQNGQR
ncbi:MAG: serine dehydratase subunit alpha family protein [Dorea sp.]|nr:serine dehydratase subunit alpha family protein [Dorea sp.]